jgi:hypothetical protein
MVVNGSGAHFEVGLDDTVVIVQEGFSKHNSNNALTASLSNKCCLLHLKSTLHPSFVIANSIFQKFSAINSLIFEYLSTINPRVGN